LEDGRKSQYESRRRAKVFFAANDGKRFIVQADEELTAFLDWNPRIALAMNYLD
jgi:hypothetical protein